MFINMYIIPHFLMVATRSDRGIVMLREKAGDVVELLEYLELRLVTSAPMRILVSGTTRTRRVHLLVNQVKDFSLVNS